MHPFSLGAAQRLAYVCAMPIEVPNRAEWFPKTDAFPRPDWPAIWGWERAWVEKSGWSEAGDQIVRHWLGRLRDTLGGSYTAAESDHFHLFSALDDSARARMLQFLEHSRERLLQTLGDVAWNDAVGKDVVLRFSDPNDYYTYIAPYDEPGEHAMSGGMLLQKDFVHIVHYEQRSMEVERMTLAHELSHNFVAHLPLPTWLNEAIAKAFEADFGGGRFSAFDGDIYDEHKAYWNEETIQQFWMGRSFQTVEGQRVSYSLAQILLDLIHREVRPPPEVFRRFVKQSCWQDAGEAAALEQLEVSIGEIASVFLGEGQWAPKPASWTWGTKSE